MAEIKSNHTAPLGLPRGPLIPAGQTVEVKNWNLIENHNVIKAWLAAGVIEVVEGSEPEKTDDDDSDAGNSNDNGNSDEDAEKDELIKQLKEFGIEKNRRSSVESLKKALDDALEADDD